MRFRYGFFQSVIPAISFLISCTVVVSGRGPIWQERLSMAQFCLLIPIQQFSVAADECALISGGSTSLFGFVRFQSQILEPFFFFIE